MESAKIIAALTRLVGDVGAAEDLAQDAIVTALDQWPQNGIPDKPGAWLMSAAKRRAIDALRRTAMAERKHELIGHDMEALQEATASEAETVGEQNFGDDILRLIFMTCHPVLSTDARVALTLRLLGGLTTQEIARAFLSTEPTIAQRIVRAKRSLTESKVPFETPRGEELGERLASVLEVIYLIFNEGYSATAGDDWLRPALCEDALRLGRILATLAPREGEVHGLVALMEIQASRTRARVGPKGEPVLLLDQDRAKWDQLLINRGLAALARAEQLSPIPGSYTIQAAIVACHARARTSEETDWIRIVFLYDALLAARPSPIVELNRAVAVSMAYGPLPALELVDELRGAAALKGYHLLPAVRGDLLLKLGRRKEAQVEFLKAAELTRNERERLLLLERASQAERSEPDSLAGKT